MAKSTTQNAKRLTKHKRNRKQTNCKNRINRTDFSGSALHRWKSMMKGIISSLSLFLSEKTWHSIFVKVGSLESGLRVVPKDCRHCKRMREESQVPFSSLDSKAWSARFFQPPLACDASRTLFPLSLARNITGEIDVCATNRIFNDIDTGKNIVHRLTWLKFVVWWFDFSSAKKKEMPGTEYTEYNA